MSWENNIAVNFSECDRFYNASRPFRKPLEAERRRAFMVTALDMGRVLRFVNKTEACIEQMDVVIMTLAENVRRSRHIELQLREFIRIKVNTKLVIYACCVDSTILINIYITC